MIHRRCKFLRQSDELGNLNLVQRCKDGLADTVACRIDQIGHRLAARRNRDLPHPVVRGALGLAMAFDTDVLIIGLVPPDQRWHWIWQGTGLGCGLLTAPRKVSPARARRVCSQDRLSCWMIWV